MTSAIHFELPIAWQAGLPAAVVLVAIFAWAHARRGVPLTRLAALASLRAVALGVLVLLSARPIRVQKESTSMEGRKVVILLDKSESMSIEENGRTRYESAVAIVKEQLIPALTREGWPIEAMLFAEDASAATGVQIATAKPDGRRSNIGAAIARASLNSAQPPRAIIALTDGAANEKTENPKAIAALIEMRVPFIGIGIGSDTGARTLTLRQIDAPSTAPPNQSFDVSAHLEMANVDSIPEFDLVLMRNGQFHQKKTVRAGEGSRYWIESFRVSEKGEGSCTYSVQMVAPMVKNLICANSVATTSVRISDEKELRVLYVQGALTWDYKFISLALRSDPGIKITGLARTSTHSVFRQNVESAGELQGGFPTRIEEMAPYRVVVLASLNPTELSHAQQELVARFCGELGGGLLMIGGPSTFDGSWHGSRLEQLLPVVFATGAGVQGLDRQFRLQFTDDALQHPVFQITDDGASRSALDRMPTFTQYGRVDSAKPGAQVWALHQTDDGPAGKRILMAAQRYGAGISSVICVQNFWRWRLAKESDPQHFDRFWRQLFRHLSESSRQDVAIHLAEQELRPQADVQVVLERQAAPKDALSAQSRFSVKVEAPDKKIALQQNLELFPSRPVNIAFRAEKPGLYAVTVHDSAQAPVASRTIEIRDVNVEFQNTARNMELLNQWASLSSGVALKAEDCRDASELVTQLREKLEQAARNQTVRTPVGVNGWSLAIVLGALGCEWLLRRRWALT